MVKAIIFDFFGVLAARGLGRFVRDYLGHDPLLLAQAKKLSQAGDMGLISRNELYGKLAQLGGVSAQTVEDYHANLHINQEIIDLIKHKLKPDYKTSILSNAAGDYADEMLSSSERQLFDDIVVSYKYKMAKPDPRIYLLAAKRLGVQPQECVFIDDKEVSANSARQAGMQAIWYRNFDQMKTELEALLADDD